LVTSAPAHRSNRDTNRRTLSGSGGGSTPSSLPCSTTLVAAPVCVAEFAGVRSRASAAAFAVPPAASSPLAAVAAPASAASTGEAAGTSGAVRCVHCRNRTIRTMAWTTTTVGRMRTLDLLGAGRIDARGQDVDQGRREIALPRSPTA